MPQSMPQIDLPQIDLSQIDLSAIALPPIDRLAVQSSLGKRGPVTSKTGKRRPVKSPLRYPGGKSRAIAQIMSHVPNQITEYREPFVGGGSVYLAMRQAGDRQIQRYWINDLNFDLYCFWWSAQNEIDLLAAAVDHCKQHYANGRDLFAHLTRSDLPLTPLQRAARFFVLNRITFSGTVDSGGYSRQAFEHRFTDSSIDRLRKLASQLSPPESPPELPPESSSVSPVQITNIDYEELLFHAGDDVFIFLDPPYLSATKSKLYGTKGNLHTAFDHERFANKMRQCPHQWLITYDDCPEIRRLFDFANIVEWTLQYGMNNYKQNGAASGRELMIKNY